MDIVEAVAGIDAELRALGSVERAAHEKAYLKSPLEHYGTSVPMIRSAAKHFLAMQRDLSHDELAFVVAGLWEAPQHERRMAAVELLTLRVSLLTTADVPLIERMLRESGTWALVDGMAANVVGSLADRFDDMGATLDRWAADSDFWIRRTALLAHLVALRRGEGDFDRFTRYADSMLDEKQFFIRKAIGWVLRDTGRKRPGLVYEWLLPRAGRASTITINEAVKPLSPNQRAAILAARAPAAPKPVRTPPQPIPGSTGRESG